MLKDGLGLDVEQKRYKRERMNTCVLLWKKYLGEKSINIEQFVQQYSFGYILRKSWRKNLKKICNCSWDSAWNDSGGDVVKTLFAKDVMMILESALGSTLGTSFGTKLVATLEVEAGEMG